MSMRYGSVCSGIEAASVAWEPLGWKAAWFSEIEKFPSAVLKYRFPNVPNLGDMTKLKEHEIYGRTTIDLLVGGTPCQSFSIAGLRRGLDDERGNLAFEYCRILIDKQPRWFVWENVPGVHSSFSDETNGATRMERDARPEDPDESMEVVQSSDFATLLEAFQECGYSVSYRILDAQYFGVAQRRRRVFVVGHLGADWRPSAAVLFERESMRGDLTKSRKKRQGVAGKAEGGTSFRYQNEQAGIVEDTLSATLRKESATTDERSVPAYTVGEWWNGEQIADTLTKNNAGGNQRMPDKDNFGADNNRTEGSAPASPAQKAGTLDAHYGDKQGLEDQHINSGASKFVPITVRLGHSKSNGHGITEGETASTLEAVSSANQAVIYENHPADSRITESVGDTPTLSTRMGNVHLTIMDDSLIVLNDQGGDSITVEKENICPTLRKETHGHEPIIASGFSCKDYGNDFQEQKSPTLRSMNHDNSHANGGGQCAALIGVQVRRLTPVECERLQGFPDGHTNIPGAKDGPRYAALGNSMAVPCMHWIGKRIQMVDDILNKIK